MGKLHSMARRQKRTMANKLGHIPLQPISIEEFGDLRRILRRYWLYA